MTKRVIKYMKNNTHKIANFLLLKVKKKTWNNFIFIQMYNILHRLRICRYNYTHFIMVINENVKNGLNIRFFSITYYRFFDFFFHFKLN